MSKRPARPAGMPWLTPGFVVKDPTAAMDFYRRAFGFETKMAIPGPGGRVMHVEMSYQDAVIMFGPEDNPGCRVKTPKSTGVDAPVSLFLYTNDVDALFQRATAAGAEVVSPPQDMFWGDRMFQVKDPDGYSWGFATNVADFDPSKVPH